MILATAGAPGADHLPENPFDAALRKELAGARRQNDALRKALETIIAMQPCMDGGSCFYPQHDGEGRYIGEECVDPIAVIGGMVAAAQNGLAPTAPEAAAEFPALRSSAAAGVEPAQENHRR